MNFETGEIVVFEFCADDCFETIGDDGDFILNKRVVEIAWCRSVRNERDVETVFDIAMGGAEAGAPSHFVTVIDGDDVLDIDVAGVAGFGEHRMYCEQNDRNRIERSVRIFEVMSPAAEKVAAGDVVDRFLAGGERESECGHCV